MTKIIKIAFLTSTNPLDKTAWSGIHYQMFTALKKANIHTEAIGPIWDILPRGIYILLNKFSLFFFNKSFNKGQNLILSFWYSIYISFILKNRTQA